jgi:hypothetical protein
VRCDAIRQSWFEVVVIAVSVAGAVALMAATEADTAAAALAAAVMAVAGTSLGHTSGQRHGRTERETREDRAAHVGAAVAVVVVFATVAALATAALHRVLPDEEAEATAALLAALAGIAGTVVANENRLRATTDVAVGYVLVLLSIVGGGLAIAWQPDGISPDAIAGYAAAFVGVASTFLGHAKARRLAGVTAADGSTSSPER